jgi:predicted RNA-binding Zn-ribbon protein involved in translation (DUF1610 family)
MAVVKTLAGRVIRAACEGGVAELSVGIGKGDLLYYLSGDEKVIVRITRVETWPYRGPQGHFIIVKPNGQSPPVFTELYHLVPEAKEGVFLRVGKDAKGAGVDIRLNSVFKNVLIGGKTQQGKTQLSISLAEQLLEKHVPHLIFDTQGEFTNLRCGNDLVTITRAPDETLAALKQRQTVIVDLLGLADSEKAQALTDVLERLKQEKERDYRKTRKTGKHEYPPIICTVDEVEVYAVARSYKSSEEQRTAGQLLATFAKRMVKFGVGLLPVVQQVVRLADDVRSQCNTAILFHMDNPQDLSSIRSLRYVTSAEVNLVRGLGRGEFLIVGDSVDIPTVARTLSIKTQRTKPTDFEELLELRSSRIEAPAVVKVTEEDSDDEQDSGFLCPDCGIQTRKRIVKSERLAGRLKHVHFRCPKCKLDYCTHAERWLSPPTPLVKQI